MKIYEKPKCVKCEKPAMCLVDNLWVCGDCLMELDRKMKEQRRKLLMEVIG